VVGLKHLSQHSRRGTFAFGTRNVDTFYLGMRIPKGFQEIIHPVQTKRGNIIAQRVLLLVVCPIKQVFYRLFVCPKRTSGTFDFLDSNGGGIFAWFRLRP
jgi:hypothetical protein